MRTFYVVLCPRTWSEGLVPTGDDDTVEVEIRSPSGCWGYMPLFETRASAETWSGGHFDIVEFRVFAAPTGSARHAPC